MQHNKTVNQNNPFENDTCHVSHYRRILPTSRLASSVLLGVGLLGPGLCYALTPTQQAVADYFTNASLCTSGGGGGGDASLAESTSNVFLPAVVGAGGYDCSSLAGAGGSNLFQTGIERLLNDTEFDTEAALQGLAFEEVITMGTLNIEVNGAHMANLTAHVEGLHQGSIGMRHASLPADRFSAGKPSGGGASADSNANGIGFFVNTKGSKGDKDASTIETGFDFNAYNITAGMDVRLNNMLVVGLAAGYGNIKSDYTTSNGNMDMDAYSVSAFGTLYKKDKYYIDGILNLARNKFDSTRTFTDPNGTTQTANARTDGDVLTVGLGVGYEHHDRDVTIGPFARLNYTTVAIDGFSESGAGPWGLQVDKQDLTSFEGVVGMQASKVISKSWGVLIPQIRLELVHEFENESRIVNARFLGAVENGITTTLLQPTDDPDRNYINLSLATSAQFSYGRSAFVQYTGLFAQDAVHEHALELGVRWNY